VSRPRVLVEQESESTRGWSFRVRIESEKGPEYHTVRLSWVDHEYWSHGGSGPASVIGALMEFLLERGGLDTLGETFDAAVVRRLHPSVDRELPERL
jgi:hypothetical protein